MRYDFSALPGFPVLSCLLTGAMALSFVVETAAEEKPHAEAAKVKKSHGEPLLNWLLKETKPREQKSTRKNEISPGKFLARLQKVKTEPEKTPGPEKPEKKVPSKAKTIAEWSKSRAKKIEITAGSPAYIEAAPMIEEVDLEALEALARKKAKKVTTEEFLEVPPAL
ncbi:MAG: hypothetical protein P1V20_25325 [Verrucomicrobiales bacterium]|nr:hypothetical protein [Verrucomicrobiales bacterium]